MKRLLVVSILLLSLVGLQAQKVTEKWNTAYGRYEYYDSNGNMIGYRKQNVWGQWEYVNTTPQNPTPKRKYEYKSPYNTELMERVLTEKNAQAERILNQRIKVIEETIDETVYIAYEKLQEGKISQKGFDKFMKDYSDGLKITNGEVLHDYNNLLDWMYKVKRNVSSWNKQITQQTQSNISITKKEDKSSGIYAVVKNAIIHQRPDSNSPILLQMRDGGTVRILDKVQNTSFYRVESGRITGYMWNIHFK
jgi:hypothetical protein